MRRSMLAALLATMLLIRPAEAQTERVLIDATFRAIPPADDAPCMAIEAGTLTVQVVNKDEHQVRATTFRMFGYRGMDPGASVELPVTRQGNSVTVPLVGALYGWSIDVDAPVRPDDGMATRTNYTQLVGLRMTLTPQ
jgi:hypothetical protein